MTAEDKERKVLETTIILTIGSLATLLRKNQLLPIVE